MQKSEDFLFQEYHQKSAQAELWDLDSFPKINNSVKSSGYNL